VGDAPKEASAQPATHTSRNGRHATSPTSSPHHPPLQPPLRPPQHRGVPLPPRCTAPRCARVAKAAQCPSSCADTGKMEAIAHLETGATSCTHRLAYHQGTSHQSSYTSLTQHLQCCSHTLKRQPTPRQCQHLPHKHSSPRNSQTIPSFPSHHTSTTSSAPRQTQYYNILRFLLVNRCQ